MTEAWQSKFCHASLNMIVFIGALQLNYDILQFTVEKTSITF